MKKLLCRLYFDWIPQELKEGSHFLNDYLCGTGALPKQVIEHPSLGPLVKSYRISSH